MYEIITRKFVLDEDEIQDLNMVLALIRNFAGYVPGTMHINGNEIEAQFRSKVM